MRQLREGLFKGRFCCQAGRDVKPTVGPQNTRGQPLPGAKSKEGTLSPTEGPRRVLFLP